MLLVVMTVMGAFYPAVDFTAGERERHTAETTMLLPVPRLAVHQGKILAVCVCAVLATSLNLLALGLSAGHLVNMLREGRTIDIVLPIGAFLSVLPLALLFAFFVSAVLTGVAALARTFKEGQALLGPVQMLFIFPAMAGAIPGLELDRVLCFVPVVNVVLAFRALLKGQSMPVEYLLTALTLLVLAVVATWVALRILSRESLVASEKGFSISQMWRVLRSSGGAR
jgi:ABC-type Na+ efflux pump permease subunit